MTFSAEILSTGQFHRVTCCEFRSLPSLLLSGVALVMTVHLGWFMSKGLKDSKLIDIRSFTRRLHSIIFLLLVGSV